MNPYNQEILSEIFNWHSISEISEIEIQRMAERMKYPLDDIFLLKYTWSYFKKCTVFNLDNNPILLLKYIRDHYFQEILGLHLTRYFFDPELGFKDYLTGLYTKKKKGIPFILTTYEEGKHIGNHDISKFTFLLGRQYYLHEILCLYDVFNRHFVVRSDSSLCRIDFGRCFENLQKKYLGFHDFLKQEKLAFFNDEFQKGYNFEKELIKNNLRDKKRDLIDIIRKIKTLRYDKIIIFDVERFSNRIIDHWSKIGFLKDAEITQCEWI